MDVVLRRRTVVPGGPRGRVGVSALVVLALLAVVLAAAAAAAAAAAEPKSKLKGTAIVPVVSARVARADIPVHLSANGTVAPLQSVDVRAQISATIKTVHIREGQYVRQGERLFSLDVRMEEANLGKSEAQLAKSRADLATAERNLQRQRELFSQKFIAQTALDTVQNQVDSLHAQVAADRATVSASRVTRGFGEIVAPIGGRLGSVAVYPGSLVQPSGPALVGITQIDPINVVFTLPERELPVLQHALASGGLAVSAHVEAGARDTHPGQLVFLDNSVDSASGTIRLKARFANTAGRLWPGMFVNVALAPQTLRGALSVPVQAVQTGPEQTFLYAIDAANKVVALPLRVLLIQDGLAVIVGADIQAGLRVVVEGAQNLRPGSSVSEIAPTAPATPAPLTSGASSTKE